MPIVIDPNTDDKDNDLIAQVVHSRSVNNSTKKKRAYTPANTFHSDFNGSGNGRGRVTNAITPIDADAPAGPQVNQLSHKFTERKGDNKLTATPLGIPTPLTWSVLSNTMAKGQFYDFAPDVTEMFDMSDDLTGQKADDYKLFFDIQPEVLAVEKKSSTDDQGKTHNDYTTFITYRQIILLAHVDDLNDEGNLTCEKLPVYMGNTPIKKEHRSAMRYYFSHVGDEDMYVNRTDFLRFRTGVLKLLSDQGGFEDKFTSYSAGGTYKVYDRICDMAEIIRTEKMVDRVWNIISQIAEALDNGTIPDTHRNAAINALAQELRRLDDIEVPLDCYSKLYTKIDSLNDRDLATLLIKQNMQLNLNGNLQQLHKQKAQLSVPGKPNPNNGYTINPRYSNQQVAAISTQEPLVIVQAGAGTGKSTTINERMSYLEVCDVEQKNIMVLSFTNAAADHIKELRPGVSSWTIAGMIHTIYARNFPSHQISTLQTIQHSISIYYGDQAHSSNFLIAFTDLLRAIDRDGSNANMTRLSTFVERYTDEVIEVLDTIGQSSLELEIIISYLKINDDDFAEPFDSPNYIIIDEVQDNSSFEFVFALRYAAKHNCSLYLVGDSSQTLYEFRSADPKALNALEGSGVFTPYRLTTNYRSNQEILDFANVHLKDIEANQYAQIQLKANSLDVPTAQSFAEKVNVYPVPAKTQKAFNDQLDEFLMHQTVRDFVDANLERDEETAFLCPTRRQAAVVEAFLKENYPSVAYANLTSERPFDSTVFSSYIAKYWDEVTAVDPTMAARVFCIQIKKRLASINRVAAKRPDLFNKYVMKWWSDNSQTVQGFINVYAARKASDPDGAKKEFFTSLKKNIISYEIRNNSIQQNLVRQRNEARKEAQAKTKPRLYVSTIHGVKGLEFDNTVVLQPPTSGKRAFAESTKRQYYVALTRAKIRELIIVGEGSYDSQVNLDYKSLLHALEARDAKAQEKKDEAAVTAADSADDDSVDVGNTTDTDAVETDETKEDDN